MHDGLFFVICMSSPDLPQASFRTSITIKNYVMNNKTRVVLKGTGFVVRVWVDEKAVNVEGDVPQWLKLFASSPLKMLEKTLEKSFKRLPG